MQHLKKCNNFKLGFTELVQTGTNSNLLQKIYLPLIVYEQKSECHLDKIITS